MSSVEASDETESHGEDARPADGDVLQGWLRRSAAGDASMGSVLDTQRW